MKGDEILVENSLDEGGVRTMHVLSSQPLDDHWLLRSPSVRRGEVQLFQDELRLYHLRVQWPAREPIRGFLRGAEQIEWPLVLWSLEKGRMVSEQIKTAAEAHYQFCGFWPDFAWLRALPRNVEIGTVVNLDLEGTAIVVLQADWVPERCIYVGRGRGRYVNAGV